MQKNKKYAILTCDIVGYTKLDLSNRDSLFSALKSVFLCIKRELPRADIISDYNSFRGDSFQIVLSNPVYSLRSAIVTRAHLISNLKRKKQKAGFDTRIAIGIGDIDYYIDGPSPIPDGEGPRLSGRLLDDFKGKKNRRLLIKTPWDDINNEFDAPLALLDALINKWTVEQARAILGVLQGSTQDKIAAELGISQPSVLNRLKLGGSWAIEILCKRFETAVQQKDL